MNFAKTVVLVKRFAAILLAVCFVLPLSYCSQKESAILEKNPVAKRSTVPEVRYGIDIAMASYEGLVAGNIDDGGLLLAVVGVFFGPVVCLGLGKRMQTLIILLAAYPAGGFLYLCVFVFSEPRIGGWLACGCWTLLVVASLFNAWELWRDWRKKARSVPGLA